MKLAASIIQMLAVVSRADAPPRLNLDLPKVIPATRPSEPAVKDAFVPKLPVRPDRRAARKLQQVRESQPPVELPPLVSTSTDAPPGRVTFDEPDRYRAGSLPAATLRLPNLINTPRRAAVPNNPYFNPAPAVSTPTIANTNGTGALGLMPPFVRRLAIDLAPPPAPLAVGEAPYMQAPGVDDVADAPVGSGGGPAVRLD